MNLEVIYLVLFGLLCMIGIFFFVQHAESQILLVPATIEPGKAQTVSEDANPVLAQAEGISGAGEHKEAASFTFHPIGFVHSTYSPQNRPPRQGRLAPDVIATIEICEEFEEGLEGIEDFDHIYVLFVFDRTEGWNAKVNPHGASKPRGVFATRSPNRPCPIGLTAVRLEKREGRILHVAGLDAFDGTPILDIKPYLGWIDAFPESGKKVKKDLGFK